MGAVCAVCMLLTGASSAQTLIASADQQKLRDLSLEQLGNVEVTSVKKDPEQIWKTAAAIFVITQDDIQRSGATTIADALRLAPGVEVGRISSTTWAIGIRGLHTNRDRSVAIRGAAVNVPIGRAA